MDTAERRIDWLRLHGAGAQQRLPPGGPLLLAEAPAADEGPVRPDPRRGPDRGRSARLGGDLHRLARSRPPQGHRHRRHRDAGRQPRGDRDRSRKGRQGGVLREAARQHGEGIGEDAGGGEEGRRPPHGLPQLPPGAGGDARQAADRRGQARDAVSLSRDVSAGLDRRPRLPARTGGCGRKPPGPARSATSPHTRWISHGFWSARSPR